MRALDLYARLRRIDNGPCVVLLQIGQGGCAIDLLLLRPRSVLVAVLKDTDGPVQVHRGHPWLTEARAARAALLGLLQPTTDDRRPTTDAPTLNPSIAPTLNRSNAQSLQRLELGFPVAAVIMTPSLDTESQITLDVEDHRERVKLLGLDELAPLAAMLQAGAQLDEAAMHGIVERLGGTLWHDGEQLRFEIGLAPYELRVLNGEGQQRHPLLEGANILGRRTTPVQYEYRLAFPGDDSISADHAILFCAPDGRVVLRDTSTNGSYIRLMDGGEQRIHRAEHTIDPGTTLRIGETLLRLEQKGEVRSQEPGVRSQNNNGQ